MEFDFKTPNLDLAEEVLEIADECNPRSFRIKINYNIDIASLARGVLKETFPDLDESVLDEIVKEYQKKRRSRKGGGGTS